jgi:hypothetical protein
VSDHKSIFAALAAFQSECPPIPKTRTAKIPGKGDGGAGGYSYKYADLGDILDAIRPVLATHGLSFTQAALTNGSQVGCRTTVHHDSGGAIEGEPLTLNAGPSPQTAGSALTYARRYSLTAALGIATEEDDDAAGATYGGGAEKASSASPAPRSAPNARSASTDATTPDAGEYAALMASAKKNGTGAAVKAKLAEWKQPSPMTLEAYAKLTTDARGELESIAATK